MVSKRDEFIDFDKLESKVNKAVEDEKLYWLRNDAKFRAVRQKVGTYDEFREIVNAAHLRPLEKDDKLNMEQKVKQPWNSQSHGRSSSLGLSDVESTQRINPNAEACTVPKNCHAFVRYWRSCATAHDKLLYLQLIGSESLHSLFKVEVPFGLLGEIITVMSDCFCTPGTAQDPAGLDFALSVLKSLSMSGRFQLALSFLTPREVELLKGLFGVVAVAEAAGCFSLLKVYGIE